MSTGKIVGITAAVLVLGCAYTHRRVIKALIKHEPMPKAPQWHVWVKPENRRTDETAEAAEAFETAVEAE